MVYHGSMEFDFYKLHVNKNDFALANFLYAKPPDGVTLPGTVKKVCQHHTGIGANGLLIVERGDEHEIKIRCFSAGGEENAQCNDGIVCAAKYAFDSGFANRDRIGIETARGVVLVEAIDSANFRIDLGPPHDLSGEHEISEQPDKDFNSIIELDGIRQTLMPMYLRRHAAVMITNQHRGSLKRIGDGIRAAFKDFDIIPIFLRIYSRDQIAMHVRWYRKMPDFSSAGGAAVVAAIANGFCEQTVLVSSNRHTLFAQWNQADNHVMVTMSPQYVFSGSFYMDDPRR